MLSSDARFTPSQRKGCTPLGRVECIPLGSLHQGHKRGRCSDATIINAHRTSLQGLGDDQGWFINGMCPKNKVS